MRGGRAAAMRSASIPSVTSEVSSILSLTSFNELTPERSPNPTTFELESEVMQLRATNSELRKKNEVLQQHVELIHSSGKTPQALDDPFEPPPEARPLIATVPAAPVWLPSPASPVESTSAPPSELQATELFTADDTASLGGDEDQQDHPLMQIDVDLLLENKSVAIDGAVPKRWAKQIPKGIVQQARARFE